MGIRVSKSVSEWDFTLVDGGALSGASADVDKVRVPFKCLIKKCYGHLNTGTGVTTLELNVQRGATKTVIGTLNVTTTEAELADARGTHLDAGDYLVLDRNAAGTSPRGASLTCILSKL